MKNIGKLAVLGAVLTASASFAFASTIGSYASGSNMGNSNTALVYEGFVPNNGNTASFAQDPIGDITNTPQAAVNIGAGAPWHDAQSNSSWVSYIANTNPASGPGVVAPQGYYTFTTQFGVGSTGLYDITLNLLADDTVAVFLNTGSGFVNVVQAGPLGNDGACSEGGDNCETITTDSFLATLTGGTNNNTLAFVVEQTGHADFGLDFTGTVSPAPEPSSLMLLGTGLVSAAGAFLRKRVTA